MTFLTFSIVVGIAVLFLLFLAYKVYSESQKTVEHIEKQYIEKVVDRNRLSAKVSVCQSARAQLQQVNKLLEDDNLQCQNKISYLTQEQEIRVHQLENSQRNSDHWRAKSYGLQELVGQQSAQNASLKIENQTFETNLHELQMQKSQLSASLQELNRSYSSLNAEKSKIEKVHGQVLTEKSQLQENLKSLIGQKAQVEQGFEMAKQEIQNLMDTKHQLLKDLESLQDSNKRLVESEDQLTQDLLVIQTENQQWGEEFARLESAKNSVEEVNHQFREQIEILGKEKALGEEAIQDVQGQLDEIQKQKQENEATIQQLKNHLEEVRLSKQTEEKSLTDHKKQMDSLHKQLAQAHLESNQWKDKFSASEKEMAKLEKSRDQLKEKIKEKSSEASPVKAKGRGRKKAQENRQEGEGISPLRRSLADAHRTIEFMENEKQRLSNFNKVLTHEIEQLKMSLWNMDVKNVEKELLDEVLLMEAQAKAAKPNFKGPISPDDQLKISEKYEKKLRRKISQAQSTILNLEKENMRLEQELDRAAQHIEEKPTQSAKIIQFPTKKTKNKGMVDNIKKSLNEWATSKDTHKEDLESLKVKIDQARKDLFFLQNPPNQKLAS